MICALTLLALCACAERPTEENARKRAEAYAQAVNFAYETPEEIYAFLTEDVKARISQPAFCAAFAKDRTYPYITPLYLFYPEVSMADDGLSATVVYQQAARIIGMKTGRTTWTIGSGSSTAAIWKNSRTAPIRWTGIMIWTQNNDRRRRRRQWVSERASSVLTPSKR